MIDNGDGTFTDPSTGIIYDSTLTNVIGSVGGIAPVGPQPVSTTGNPTSLSGGGFSLAGVGTFLTGVATSVGSIYRTVAGSGVNTINPATGQPYTTAQLQALAQRNAAMQSGGSLLPLAIVAILIVLLLRK